MGIHKPGVTFCISPEHRFSFSFQSLASKYPRHAYNVPRPAFDNLLREKAIRSGAQFVPRRANPVAEGRALRLSLDDMAWVPGWGGRQPDLVIDATGRRRLAAKIFGIDSTSGPRRDVSYFAHFANLGTDAPLGHVCINRLATGWSWRIPLRGKTSFGIVLDALSARGLGCSREDRLESALKDPSLGAHSRHAERISEVVTYANYQLVSNEGHGENWAAVGDAFGFVDPMLSPGMHLALSSADRLDRALSREPLSKALASYSAEFHRELKAWMDFIAYFYDGRIFHLHEFGTASREQWKYLPVGMIEKFMSSTLAAMASGFTTASPFSRGILKNFERFSNGTPESFGRYAIL
jgi:flavin-dependent dehydrogenase